MPVTLNTIETTVREAAKIITLEAGDVLKISKNDVEDTELTITAPVGVTLQVYVSVRATS